MTDDSPSRGTCNTPSFPTISDYYGLGQNTLETNLIVSALLIPLVYRNSHRRCFVTKGVPRNFAKFTTLLKKDSGKGVFL